MPRRRKRMQKMSIGQGVRRTRPAQGTAAKADLRALQAARKAGPAPAAPMLHYGIPKGETGTFMGIPDRQLASATTAPSMPMADKQRAAAMIAKRDAVAHVVSRQQPKSAAPRQPRPIQPRPAQRASKQRPK